MKTAEETLLEFYNKASFRLGDSAGVTMEEWQQMKQDDNDLAVLAEETVSAMNEYASQAIDQAITKKVDMGGLEAIVNVSELLKIKNELK